MQGSSHSTALVLLLLQSFAAGADRLERQANLVACQNNAAEL
jgi:hypothetical protein